jgi:rubrerythrin
MVCHDRSKWEVGVSLLRTEPFAAVETIEELLAIANWMEQEAIGNYRDLSARMHREGRPDMVEVFDRLAAEEAQHLDSVQKWSERLSGSKPDLTRLKWEPAGTFDDEGANAIAPELLSAYRAFSMAVRNEERAFLFWTYVAAQTDQEQLRLAAEQMAREELGHLTILRQERRRAFHFQKDAKARTVLFELPELELRFADLLQALATRSRDAGPTLAAAAQGARERAAALARRSFGPSPLLRDGVDPAVSGRVVPLCELLLDCYLDHAEHLAEEADRDVAQAFAGRVIECRSALRAAVV